MLIRAKCFACGFEVVFELKLNEHGFYELSHGYCPNCMALLDQDVTYTSGPIAILEETTDAKA